MERTFSAPLSFFFFFLSFVGDWGANGRLGEPLRTPGLVVSPFCESSDSLGEVIDIADCLDLRDGDAVLVEEDWLRAPLEAPPLEKPIELEWVRLRCLPDPLVWEEYEVGGVLGTFFLFRKVSGVRPLFCFSDGEGDTVSMPDALDAPETARFP